MSRDYFGELEPEEVFVPVRATRSINFEGQRFGKWVALKKMGRGMYECRCDCGVVAKRSINLLVNLKSSQCKECYKKSKECFYFMKSQL